MNAVAISVGAVLALTACSIATNSPDFKMADSANKMA
jgi:hypothetical protein